MSMNLYALSVEKQKGGYFETKSILWNSFLWELLPSENWESLNQLIFLLVKELKYSEDVIMKMDYHIAIKRLKQLEDFNKIRAKELESMRSKLKIPNTRY